MFLVLSFFGRGKLDENDGRKYEDTADPLAGSKSLVEHQPAADDGEDRFKAHDETCDLRRAALLRKDLQGVGDTAGEKTGEEDGLPCSEDARKLRCFHDERKGGGNDGIDCKLQAGETDTVRRRNKAVNSQNVRGVEEGAEKQENIARLQRKTFCDAEKIHTAGGDPNAYPAKQGSSSAKENAENGNENDVERGEKAGFTCTGLHDAHLLEIRGKGEQYAAKNTADPEIFFAVFRVHTEGFASCNEVGDEHHRNECRNTYVGTYGVEGGRSDVVHALPLSNKGKAPDEGCNQQHQRTDQLIFSFFMHVGSSCLKDIFKNMRIFYHNI